MIYEFNMKNDYIYFVFIFRFHYWNADLYKKKYTIVISTFLSTWLPVSKTIFDHIYCIAESIN